MNSLAPRRAFTLVEIMVVVVIILVMTGATALMLANSSDGVRLRRDTTSAVAFLRNMWDLSKASSEPIVLIPDFETGALSYIEPKSGIQEKAHFSSKARVVGILVNDRLFHKDTEQPEPPPESEEGEGDDRLFSGIYLSEGRGLTRVGIIMAVMDDDEYELMNMATLNLINGRSQLLDLDPDAFFEMIDASDSAVQDAELATP